MGLVITFQQRRHRYFVKCIAVAAVIFLVISSGVAQSTTTSQPAAPLQQVLKDNPELLSAFGQLLEKLQHGVQFPPPRAQSRLLSLLPESTVFYGAFPNYGDASHQALMIFEQEVKENPALHAWWQQREMAVNGPKVQDSLEKFYQLSQYLGDEIVVSGAVEGRKDPNLLILAEVRKPGLKDFLQQMVKELSGKSKASIRVLDRQDLITAKDTSAEQELLVLVRPDFVVGALNMATLRSFDALLNRNRREFVSTPFGQRLAQSYEGGTTAVAGVDFQKILDQLPAGSEQSKIILQRTGFADAKYLIWEHKGAAGQGASQMELSFTGRRHGVASWLAAPGPLGSLDFVSPKAVVASSVRLKDPAQIFEDVEDFSAASNPNARAALAQMEQALKVNLKDDLFGLLGGEITYEVDSLTQPNLVWKALFRVNDPDRLQATLTKLLAAGQLIAQPSETGGLTYYTLRIPSGRQTVEITYAFADGYLIIASSPAAVSEAVRIHRTGESLAKSKKLLASLPPGPASEVSALLYEDPIAMAALSLRQVLPGLGESFPQAMTETPTVICAYGEESAIRETSRSAGVDAGAVLVMAAIAIPNLLRARIAANESSAVGTVRLVNTAQIAYSSMYHRGYARDLATLGPYPSGAGRPSAEHASLLDATLGNASCTAGAWCAKTGFQFSITAVCKEQRCEEFVVVGTPVSSSTGLRSFCSTSDAVIRVKTGPPLTTPVSASECRMWPPLQ